jgi:hypothetical protein
LCQILDLVTDAAHHFVHTYFRATIRRVLALTAIRRVLALMASRHSLDSNKVGAFIFSTVAYSEHLYMDAPAGYDND